MGSNGRQDLPQERQAEFYEGKATVDDPQALGKLVGPFECVEVTIKNRLMNLDNTANPLELLIGTGGGCIWPLLPGEESPLIYVKNLNDVWVRVRTAVTRSIITGGVVDFDVSDGGLGYAVDDLVTVDDGNDDAVLRVTAVINGRVFTVTIAAAGLLYTAGDVLTVSGGGVNATLTVNTVGGGGDITGLSVLFGGSGYIVAAAVPLTGGTGAGAQANITAVHNGIISAASIVNAGSGYTVAAGVALTGGSGDGAEIDVTDVADIADEVAFPYMVCKIDPTRER